MPCGRKRPFMVTVFQNANFQNETGSNTRANVHEYIDIQTVHNLREDSTQVMSNFSNVQEKLAEYGENDINSSSVHQKRHCLGLQMDIPSDNLVGLDDQEMMVCDEYPPQDQTVPSNQENGLITFQKVEDNRSAMSSFPMNSFPLAGLNKSVNNNSQSCSQCISGQGGHFNHVAER